MQGDELQGVQEPDHSNHNFQTQCQYKDTTPDYK